VSLLLVVFVPLLEVPLVLPKPDVEDVLLGCEAARLPLPESEPEAEPLPLRLVEEFWLFVDDDWSCVLLA
jgi:hypothetical protein